jgi:uncharacterized protein YecE (DUF72 family)
VVGERAADSADRIRVGTAGWSVPRPFAPRLPPAGSQLERYASVFEAAEINSAFHRPHASSTYARWAASTPDGFRFAVKVPKLITHEQALRRPRAAFRQFVAETSGLGGKRGPLLVQLPPSLAFEIRLAERFFSCVRDEYDGPLVCEPRHATWFGTTASILLERHRVARVAADPARVTEAAMPGGWRGLTYVRLHGSPRTYWSRYDDAFVDALASRLVEATARGEVWCVFDNTASGAAIENAWELRQRLSERASASAPPRTRPPLPDARPGTAPSGSP